MAYYSRRHYRAVSPAADTQAQIMERALAKRACELGLQDRELRYPELTAANADEAIAYQEAQIQLHTSKLRTQPNWRKSTAEITKLVRSAMTFYVPGQSAELDAQNVAAEKHAAAVIKWIEETGDCVWHASASVRGTRCSCTACRNEGAK